MPGSGDGHQKADRAAIAGTGWVGWLGNLVPGRFGNIHQRVLGRSIAAEIALHSRDSGEVIRENAAMKRLAAQLDAVS